MSPTDGRDAVNRYLALAGLTRALRDARSGLMEAEGLALTLGLPVDELEAYRDVLTFVTSAYARYDRARELGTPD